MRLHATAPSAPAAVLELHGYRLRRLGEQDRNLVDRWLDAGLWPALSGLGSSTEMRRGFFESLGRQMWGPTMVVLHSDCPTGMLSTMANDVRSLTAGLLMLFDTPPARATPLLLYIRHLLWSFPMHRLYAHVPLLAELAYQEELLQEVGFQREGVLVQHGLIGDHRYDVAVLGLLRPEFVECVARAEPRLKW